MRKFALAFAAAAALYGTTPAEAATTLIDEDFESGFGVFTPTGQVGINAGSDYIACCGVTGSAANLANHFASFGSGDQPSGTLTSPTFDFTSGNTYTLDFDFAELGSGTEQFFVEIWTGSTLSASVILTSAANNDLDTTFSHVIVPFTPLFGGGLSYLTIHSAGGSSVDSILDNFVFTTSADIPSTSGVPEPATWAMMLLGMGAVGMAMRRRKVPVLT
jgi:hypothetical protein